MDPTYHGVGQLEHCFSLAGMLKDTRLDHFGGRALRLKAATASASKPTAAATATPVACIMNHSHKM